MTWGPFRDDLPELERVARCRALAALVQVCTGPAGKAVVTALRGLEANSDQAPAVLAAFDRLPSRPRRNALASYARLHSPATGK